jgi:uncharacterized spore protein YtfJ
MKVTETLQRAQDAMSVRRVFGEPWEKNGVTIIPVAKVAGGGGGGEDNQSNGGAGFGLTSRPVGALVIKDGKVSWRPALDLNRVIVGCQLIAAAAIFAAVLTKGRREPARGGLFRRRD